jgi:hypothetical protein
VLSYCFPHLLWAGTSLNPLLIRQPFAFLLPLCSGMHSFFLDCFFALCINASLSVTPMHCVTIAALAHLKSL